MPSGPPRRRRARPVADAPVDGLLSRSEDLAKGWLLALLEDAPLQDAQGILAVDLSRDGPRLCDAVLRALVSDTDLHRLGAGGLLTPLAARIGELAGARDPQATSRAVDALHGVIWAALSDELRGPDPALVAELAERLALVTEHVRVAALLRLEPRSTSEGQPAPPPVHLAPEPPLSEEQPSDAQTRALWVDALEDEIRGARGAPLSLLLAELQDADRVSAVESGTEASATFSEFAQAVRSVVRRQDILVSETPTRAWIIARDTGRGGAQALGDRLTVAVREQRPWRGAELTASAGVAVLGEDGRTASELIDAAEEARFAAEAAGVGVQSTPDEDPAD